MLIFSIVGFILILAYTVYCSAKCKCIPPSISSSVYSLSKRNKWIFSFVMWAVGFMIAPYLFESVSENSKFLVWIMIASLLGIGADPLEEGSKNVLHYVSAAICGISSQMLVFFNQPSILLLWSFYVPYTLFFEGSGKNMMFAEITMVLSIAILCLL